MLERSAPSERSPSIFVSAFNKSAYVLARAGIFSVPLEESTLLEEARRQTSLDDFGDEAFRNPLRKLLDACESKAALNLFGRFVAQREALQLLINRLRLTEDRKRHPEIAGQTIRRPIFVVGLPRSGTTLLHALLAQDPANRAPLTWEAIHLPVPGERGNRDDAGPIKVVERQIRWFHRIAPEFKKIHPVDARLPQECIAITAHTFASPRFHTTYRIPSYQKWLDHADHRPCYAFHRRYLQHLQFGSREVRWVLKSPAHLFSLDSLFAEYPDALAVQTHRDPVTVLASVASLTAALQGVFSNTVDRREIGAEVAGRWTRGIECAMQARKSLPGARERFCDVHYADLMRDPIATVQRIYAHFELPLSRDALTHMQKFLATNPKNKHGVHRYDLAHFGLDLEEESARFRHYREAFGIERESHDARDS